MMRWIAVLAAALLMVGGGCDGPQDDSEPPQTQADQRDTAAETPDYVVRSDQWPDDVERIVSMAPNVTEMLFELGLGDRVVAVTRYCDWPNDVDDLPTIGGMLDPDFEAILGAEPDVVVGAMDGADHEIADRFDSAGVEYGFIAIDDFDSVKRGIETLGTWLDVDERADAVLEAFREGMDGASAPNTGDEMTALMVLDRDPIVAAGPGSFSGELLEAAGLRNTFGDEVDDYPILDAEQVLDADPGVIVDIVIDVDDDIGPQYWERFDTLEAVNADRVIYLDDPVMMRPGPRIPEAVELLSDRVRSL